jgi:hypothetical protein
MQVERITSTDLLVNRLPDGSKVIVDPAKETVFALNATAGAAWDACGSPTTLSKVAQDMQRSLNAGITEDVALEAILQLRDKNLVTTSELLPNAARRKVFKVLGAIAVPVVISMAMSEQRAFSLQAGSQGDPIPQ